MRRILFMLLFVGCQSAPETAPTPTKGNTGPAANAESQKVPALAVEVVDVPWVGDVVATDPELCPIGPDPALDAKAPFTKIEVSKAGIAMIETATAKSDKFEKVVLEVGGCTHEKATFEFTVAGQSDKNEEALIAYGLEILKALPLKDRGIIYRDEIVDAENRRERDEELVHSNVFVKSGAEDREGKQIVWFHYDRAL